MNYAKCIFAVLVVFLLSNCSGDSQPEDTSGDAVPDLESRLRRAGPAYISFTDSSDYQADFLEAVQAGDLRFVAVMGYATEVLGVPDYQDRYKATNGHKIVEGTGDDFSYEDSVVFERDVFAREYARGYNALLLQYIADHPQ